MSAPSAGELGRRAERLTQLSAGVTTDNVLTRIQDGLTELGELTGDPAALESAAGAFARAGAAMQQVGEDTATNATSRLHAAWSGRAAARMVGESFAAGGTLLGQVRDDHDTAAGHFANRMSVLVAFGGLGDLFGDPLGAQPENPLDDIRRPTQEILEAYQVSTDPDGMVTYPDGVTGWLAERFGTEPKQLTASGAHLLDDLGLFGVKDAADIEETASTRAQTTFGGAGIVDGHSDAFRHAYWNALLTQRFDEGWTDDFTTAHERRPDNRPHPEAMDLHNNEVGRRIARENPDADPDELASLVEQAVRDGQTVVIGQDGNLGYSDQVPIGQNGRAPNVAQPPGADPTEPDDTRWSGGYNPGGSGDDDYTTSGDY